MSGNQIGNSVEEHRAILAALEADDPERVRTATETHVAHSYALMSEYLQGAPGSDPFDLASD